MLSRCSGREGFVRVARRDGKLDEGVTLGCGDGVSPLPFLSGIGERDATSNSCSSSSSASEGVSTSAVDPCSCLTLRSSVPSWSTRPCSIAISPAIAVSCGRPGTPASTSPTPTRAGIAWVCTFLRENLETIKDSVPDTRVDVDVANASVLAPAFAYGPT
jgi:hypothetical protein